MKSHYSRIIALAEQELPSLLHYQKRRSGDRDYGGRVPPERGFAEPGASAGAVAALVGLYCCSDSRYHQSQELLERAELYAEHLLREQHEDGTMDLRDTNFHDATMVGFSVQKLAYTYRLLSGQGASAGLRETIHQFLVRGAEGMLAGGFHTPNHRWVMASALSLLSHILLDNRLQAEAELYLGEGIDCTEQGEYTERSAGIYNVVSNRSLMIVAEELDRPELLDHVRRNLDMVMKYVEPDGTVFTLNSRRQDVGRKLYPVNYYENCLLMAHKTGNGSYAGMAETALSLAEEKRDCVDSLGPVLAQFLLRPELREHEIEAVDPPTSYVLDNPDSGILRQRSGNVSFSLLAGKTTFCKFQTGRNWVIAKIAGTFYGAKGRFAPEKIEREGQDIVLRYAYHWGYVRPFEQPPPTSDWDEMPHELREHIQMQDYNVTVRARFTGQELVLKIKSEGVENVMWKLELLMPPGGWLETGDLRLPGTTGGWALLKGDQAVYSVGWDKIRVSGGFAEHGFGPTMRGSEPQDPDVFTLYCTDYTPMDREVTIAAES